MSRRTKISPKARWLKRTPRRPGSDKRSKKTELVIHDEKIIRPKARIPKGSRFKGAEGDVRDYVKKRKVSGGTRSDLGRRCRDTFSPA